jgi:hypothetical protein
MSVCHVWLRSDDPVQATRRSWGLVVKLQVVAAIAAIAAIAGRRTTNGCWPGLPCKPSRLQTSIMHYHCSWQPTPRAPGPFRLHLHLQLPLPHPNSTPSAVQLTPLTRKSLSPPSHAAQQPLLLASTCPALFCPTRPWLSCLSCLSLPLLSCPILVSPAYPAVHYPAALLTLHACSAHLVPCLFCCSRRRLALRCLWTQPHLPALSVCQFGDACLYPLSFPRWAGHGGVGCYSFKRPPAPSCGSISATVERVSSPIVLSKLATWHILGPGPLLFSPPALSNSPHLVRLFNQQQAASFGSLTLDT